MMPGNPSSWWSMHPPSQLQPSASALLSSSPSLYSSHYHHHQYVLGSSSSSALLLNSLPDTDDHHNHDEQQLPHHQSSSQLLLDGLSSSAAAAGDHEERFGLGLSHFQHHHHQQQPPKKLENWEDQTLNNNHIPSPRIPVYADVKHEVSQSSCNLYGHGDAEEFQPPPRPTAAWFQVMPVSSPTSCVTSLSSNILDFSYNNSKTDSRNQLSAADQSSECNSTATGGASKKARVQPSSSRPPLKVRKEKLGDRITALHQLVSPFGKTDTASVLLEVIGYIRFLEGQIEALSSPYLGSTSSNMRNHHHPPQQHQSDSQEKPMKDLRSRGLCLVPVSCTQHVGSENGADYWAPAIGGGL